MKKLLLLLIVVPALNICGMGRHPDMESLPPEIDERTVNWLESACEHLDDDDKQCLTCFNPFNFMSSLCKKHTKPTSLEHEL